MLISVTTNFILIFIIILLSRLQYIHYQAVKSQVWQRDDRISNSLEGEREWGCCATPPVSESCAVVYPRVHPSGITRGYAWCVPAGDGGCILGSSLSSIFPPRVHPSSILAGDGGWVRKNTIRALADAIRMWADSLIAFENAIRVFTLLLISQKFWIWKSSTRIVSVELYIDLLVFRFKKELYTEVFLLTTKEIFKNLRCGKTGGKLSGKH